MTLFEGNHPDSGGPLLIFISVIAKAGGGADSQRQGLRGSAQM